MGFKIGSPYKTSFDEYSFLAQHRAKNSFIFFEQKSVRDWPLLIDFIVLVGRDRHMTGRERIHLTILSISAENRAPTHAFSGSQRETVESLDGQLPQFNEKFAVHWLSDFNVSHLVSMWMMRSWGVCLRVSVCALRLRSSE